MNMQIQLFSLHKLHTDEKLRINFKIIEEEKQEKVFSLKFISHFKNIFVFPLKFLMK